VERYYPDVRSIINNLQACSTNVKKTLNTEDYLDKLDESLLVNYIQGGLWFAARGLWSETQDFSRLFKVLADLVGKHEECRIGLDDEQRVEALFIIRDYWKWDATITDREFNFAVCVLEIMNILEVKIDFKTPF
jgi:hypothetical protein